MNNPTFQMNSILKVQLVMALLIFGSYAICSSSIFQIQWRNVSMILLGYTSSMNWEKRVSTICFPVSTMWLLPYFRYMICEDCLPQEEVPDIRCFRNRYIIFIVCFLRSYGVIFSEIHFIWLLPVAVHIVFSPYFLQYPKILKSFNAWSFLRWP